jgi:hypothetical protein
MCLRWVGWRLVASLIPDTQIGVGSTIEWRQSLQMLTNRVVIVKDDVSVLVTVTELPEKVMAVGASSSQAG